MHGVVKVNKASKGEAQRRGRGVRAISEARGGVPGQSAEREMHGVAKVNKASKGEAQRRGRGVRAISEARGGVPGQSAEREIWSRPWDSNPRPTDYESVALPAELERQLKTTTTDTSCLTTLWQGGGLQGLT